MVVLNTDILPQIRMSVDEYLAAELPEGFRYELVEGVIEVSPVPGIPHDVVIERVHSMLVIYKKQHSDVVAHVTQKSAVALIRKRTTREPDFAVYGPLEWTAPTRKSWKDVTPLFVMEVVSTGQEDRDYEQKRLDYWEAGVAEYWIADPDRRTLTVLTREPRDWHESVFSVVDSYEPRQFPGLKVVVASIFE